MRKLLNWLNGTTYRREMSKPSSPKFGRDAIEPLPQGEAPLTKWRAPRTTPLSEKRKNEYRKARDE